METKNDANLISEVVTRPKGGYGTRTKPVGWLAVKSSIIPNAEIIVYPLIVSLVRLLATIQNAIPNKSPPNGLLIAKIDCRWYQIELGLTDAGQRKYIRIKAEIDLRNKLVEYLHLSNILSFLISLNSVLAREQ
jgi:hypothetical protein